MTWSKYCLVFIQFERSDFDNPHLFELLITVWEFFNVMQKRIKMLARH